MTDPLIDAYFKNRFSKSANLGLLKGANWTADDRACRGGRDHLFLYLKIKDNAISDIKFQCGGCDQAMFVAGDILCDLIRGMNFDDIPKIPKERFSNILGGESKEAVEHFGMAMKILEKGIQNISCKAREI